MCGCRGLSLCLTLPGLVLGTSSVLGRTFSFLINPTLATGWVSHAVLVAAPALPRDPLVLLLPRVGSAGPSAQQNASVPCGRPSETAPATHPPRTHRASLDQGKPPCGVCGCSSLRLPKHPPKTRPGATRAPSLPQALKVPQDLARAHQETEAAGARHGSSQTGFTGGGGTETPTVGTELRWDRGAG